jgi:hypothetical protein
MEHRAWGKQQRAWSMGQGAQGLGQAAKGAWGKEQKLFVNLRDLVSSWLNGNLFNP